MLSFSDLALHISRIGRKNGISLPNDIISGFLWPFLSHPHQGRVEFGKLINNKNICMEELPKLKPYVGPRVIYKPPKWKGNVLITRPTVKFIYYINHSAKYVNAYITIHEFCTFDYYKFCTFDYDKYQKNIDEQYSTDEQYSMDEQYSIDEQYSMGECSWGNYSSYLRKLYFENDNLIDNRV